MVVDCEGREYFQKSLCEEFRDQDIGLNNLPNHIQNQFYILYEKLIAKLQREQI